MSKKVLLTGGLLLLLSLSGWFLYRSYTQNDGHIIYTLDDPYIHMTLAKNLAQHGTWGVNATEFSSSSSSILYTSLLALIFALTGPFVLLPWVLNVIFACTCLFLTYRIFVNEQISLRASAFLVVTLIVFTPLPALISSGMEHTLQIAINLWFIYLSSIALSGEQSDRRTQIILGLLAMLTVMVRFEGLFLIAIVTLLLLLRGRIITGAIVAGLGLLPFVAFGLWSVAQGAYFLPNSLLIKGEKPAFSIPGLVAYAFVWLRKLYSNPHLLILFIALLGYGAFLLKNAYHRWGLRLCWLYILFPVFVMHLTFARTGWFYRYEAYLIVASLVPLAWMIDDLFPRVRFTRSLTSLVALLGLSIFLFPLVKRSAQAFAEIPVASKNIYEQQYQMAQFLHQYYPQARIVANDIGAISFFSDTYILDMYGLGNTELLTLKMKGQHDERHIDQLTQRKNAQIAIIYDEWFVGKIPDSWQKVGEWEIRNNVICAFSTVSFYAVDPYEKTELARRLRKFSAQLPTDVAQRGSYLSSE